jgi:hypothetical protein
MANEVITEWSVNSIKVYSSYDGKQDVVCLAGWRLTATTGVYITFLQGTTSISVSDDLTNFKPYDDLTEDTVLLWVKNELGEEQVLELEQGVVSNLNELINPIEQYLPLPWVVEEVLPTDPALTEVSTANAAPTTYETGLANGTN